MSELKEEFFSDLVISEDEKKRTKILAVVQQADKVNKNGRIYPKEVLDEAMKALLVKIKAGQVFGEVDHPALKGKLKDTSHLVTDVFWDDKNENLMMGSLMILNTPAGEILKEIVRAKGKPGLSSRGSGKIVTTKMAGHGDVQKVEKFRFDSFDFVMNPSVINAQIKKIMENFEEAQKNENQLEIIRERAKSKAGLKRDPLAKALNEEVDRELKDRLRSIAGLPRRRKEK